MTSEHPTVAVVMAAYNAEATLPEAISSVFASIVPVHLFIVDDASHRPVVDVFVERMGDIPANVTILRSEVNTGPAGARNMAIRRIIEEGYPYAAVLDADDLAHPERFAKQATFLDANPNVAAVGTWANFVHDETLAIVSAESYPLLPSDIRRALCINSCFINSSVMFRVSALQAIGAWDESMHTGEDYDLFCRLARRYDLANIPEYLVDYRLSRGGISLTGLGSQARARLWVQLRNLPHRLHYWQVWAGVFRSTVRVLVSSAWAESYRVHDKSAEGVLRIAHLPLNQTV
jgi:glycosyltransferase involved in cell wall biosynthesis